MKRRNREISIFNMSTIDLFACATGAFILLTLILLPYYLNIDRSYLDVIAKLEGDLEETATKLAETEGELESSQQSVNQCQADLEASRSELQSATSAQQQAMQDLDACSSVTQMNFMLIVMSWTSLDDIDLHVVDPSGRRFYYDNRTNSGTRGSFEEDSTRGPGNEIWLHPAAEPGEYKVFYNFYRRKSSDTEIVVRGTVFHQQGKIAIPETALRTENAGVHQNAPLVATVVVSTSGEISVR